MRLLRRIVAVLLPWALLLAAAGCGDEKPTESYRIDPQAARMQDAWPHWCPADTSLIAYTHFPSTWEEYLEFGPETVRILDLRTLETEHVTSGVVCDWSPDGGSLIVCCDSGGYFIIELESGVKDQLPIRGYTPDFSPCGKMIAFESSEEPQGISIYHLETGETRWLGAGHEPDWSPDGSRLLCSYLVVYDTSGVSCGAIPYDDQYGYAWHARWSPVDDRVTYGSYCSTQKKDPGIWGVDADGANQCLAACPGAVPTWSPDGSKITYGARSGDRCAMVIWTVNADGTNPTQVTFPDSGGCIGPLTRILAQPEFTH